MHQISDPTKTAQDFCLKYYRMYCNHSAMGSKKNYYNDEVDWFWFTVGEQLK